MSHLHNHIIAQRNRIFAAADINLLSVNTEVQSYNQEEFDKAFGEGYEVYSPKDIQRFTKDVQKKAKSATDIQKAVDEIKSLVAVKLNDQVVFIREKGFEKGQTTRELGGVHYVQTTNGWKRVEENIEKALQAGAVGGRETTNSTNASGAPLKNESVDGDTKNQVGKDKKKKKKKGEENEEEEGEVGVELQPDKIKALVNEILGKDDKESDENEEEESEEGEENSEGQDEDPFHHHRKMAGYHGAMAKQYDGESTDMGASDDEGLRNEFRNKTGSFKHHESMAQKHIGEAKKHHDKEKHGEWGDTVPKKSEALEYGKKHAGKVEHDQKEMFEEEEQDGDEPVEEKKKIKKAEVMTSFNAKDQRAAHISSMFQTDELEKAQKKGEGSRGGHIIGHTKSGKPIYGVVHADHYKDYTADEHSEAATVHRKLHRGNGTHHERMARAHEAAAKTKAASEKKDLGEVKGSLADKFRSKVKEKTNIPSKREEEEAEEQAFKEGNSAVRAKEIGKRAGAEFKKNPKDELRKLGKKK